MTTRYQDEPRCDLSDLFKSQCAHCLYAERTLGPSPTYFLDDEEE